MKKTETKFIVVRSAFGHEIMAINFAQALNMQVAIIPNKETADEYEAESEKIANNLAFFTEFLVRVPFADRQKYENMSWDIIADLKAGKLADDMWSKFFVRSRLVPTSILTILGLPGYQGMRENRKNLLLVPQKLISDNACGVTAQQQSLNPSVFNFLKEQTTYQLVLGQHFHKENDKPAVEALAKEFGMYVPGMTENNEVFGIRGVRHEMYYSMYNQIGMSIGIAGTHTWILLTMFPWVPQVILYNRKGVENWDAIGKAFQAAGWPIRTIGFDDDTDMEQLSEKIKSYYKLFAVMAM